MDSVRANLVAASVSAAKAVSDAKLVETSALAEFIKAARVRDSIALHLTWHAFINAERYTSCVTLQQHFTALCLRHYDAGSDDYETDAHESIMCEEEHEEWRYRPDHDDPNYYYYYEYDGVDGYDYDRGWVRHPVNPMTLAKRRIDGALYNAWCAREAASEAVLRAKPTWADVVAERKSADADLVHVAEVAIAAVATADAHIVTVMCEYAKLIS